MSSGLIVPAEPLISVVMPVRNAERYVADAVRSVQAQSYPRWELIVIDSSSDGSAMIVNKCAARDSRIRMISDPPGSRGRAINAGVDLARGQMIARMDADDIALPERFAVQLHWMRKTGVEICGSCAKLFGAHKRVLLFPETHDSICRELLFRYALLQPGVLLHTEILRANRYNEQATFEGYELFTRLVRRYKAGSVPAVLLKSRSHALSAHVVEAAGCRADMRTCRGPLFHALFPDADQRDACTVDRVAEGEPFPSLAELEHAGQWLARLAQSPDRVVREQMLGRWWTSCRRSAQLGPGTYRIYKRLAPRFDVAATGADDRLRFACALRLEWNSTLDRGIRRLRHSWPRQQPAAV